MRIELKRVPTPNEVKSLVAAIRKLPAIDQIIMSPALNRRPWFDLTLYPDANESTVRNKINGIVRRVSRDLL